MKDQKVRLIRFKEIDYIRDTLSYDPCRKAAGQVFDLQDMKNLKNVKILGRSARNLYARYNEKKGDTLERERRREKRNFVKLQNEGNKTRRSSTVHTGERQDTIISMSKEREFCDAIPGGFRGLRSIGLHGGLRLVCR